MQQAEKKIAALLFLFACLFFTRNAFPIDSIELLIERLTLEQLLSDTVKPAPFYADMQLDKISLSVDLTTTPLQLKLDLSALHLSPPYNTINNINISCSEFSLSDSQFACHQGQLSFQGLFEQQDTRADLSLVYDRVNDVLKLSLKKLNIGRGNLSISFNKSASQWSSKIQADKLDYQYFKKYVKHYFYQQNKAALFDKLQEAGGLLSFTARVQGSLANKSVKSSLKQFKVKGKLQNIRYEYGDDLAENLSFNFKIDYMAAPDSAKSNVTTIDFSINSAVGEILQNDMYIVFRGNESLQTVFTHDAKSINISRFILTADKTFLFKTKGQLLFSDESLKPRLNSELTISNWENFNTFYLQNILSGTDYEDLQLEGVTVARLMHSDKNISVDLNFRQFSLAFNNELSLLNLNGDLHWNNLQHDIKPVEHSRLSWQELSLNKLPLGASEFNFVFQKDTLQLTRQTQIPIFDGALHINSLKITQLFSSVDLNVEPGTGTNNGFTLTVDGHIKPVSLNLLSTHFQWPLLDGSLSAMIPETTYNEKYLTVGGALMLHVFDGVIIVKDLKIVEPLKEYAQLFANIDLNNLSLNSLTKTYNFGEIQGRVEGKLSGLELNAWQPVAFDAYIRTPENDNSRHRISQRAIDNISSLGGASGLLSRTFLSFFKTFGYDKIGLSCKLKNNICQMNGVEAKGNSYYIVKGGGIPRIDVMGFQNKVNWQVLTSRLKAIQQANEAVIE